MASRFRNLMPAIVVGLAGATLFTLWYTAALDYQAAAGKELPRVAMLANPTDYSERQIRKLRDAVFANPANQTRFNLLYVYQASKRKSKAGPKPWLNALAQLGWRDTPAQMNLLAAGAENGELRLLLDRSDGLLRRGTITPQVLDILYFVERNTSLRSEIVSRLARNPEWRRSFFVNDHGFGTDAAVAARLATIEALRKTEHPATEAEIAPMVAVLTDKGKVEIAYRTWREAGRGEAPNTGVLADSDFAEAANISWRPTEAEGNSSRSSPFTWRLNSGPGYSADAQKSAGAPTLTLRWDGNGVPIFATQRFQNPGGVLKLHITGPDAQPQLLGRLSFVSVCEGRSIQFSKLVPVQEQALTILSDQPIDCAYPELRVMPIVGSDDIGGFEISLASLQILR